MFTPGLILFGAFSLVQWSLEFAAYNKRSHRGRERLIRPLISAIWAILGGLAVFTDYNDFTVLLFGALAAALIGATLADAALGARGRHANEQALRTTGFIFQPLVIGGLLVFWRFIDGAGFFLGAVLPMNTDHLRPLCTGFTVISSALFAYQANRALRGHKAITKKQAVSVEVPGQISTSADVAKRAS